MPNTTNLVLPYPAGSDNPAASVLAALATAVDAYAAEWASWTTTITQGVSVTFNALYCKYKVVNKTCHFAFNLDATSSGTAGQPVIIGLPPPVPRYTTADMQRGAIKLDSAGSTASPQSLVIPAGSTTTLRIVGFSGNYTTQVTGSEVLRGHGRYEVA